MMTYEYLSYFVFGTSISTYRVADLLCKIFFFFLVISKDLMRKLQFMALNSGL